MAEVLISVAVQTLADIAGNQIAKEGSRLFKLKENIAWIGEETRSIKSSMQKADAVEGLDDFIWSIWDLAYDLQDITETYFPQLPLHGRNDWKGTFGWLLKAKTVRDFAREIEKIRRRVEQINLRRQTYHQLPDASGGPGSEVSDPRRTFPHNDEVNVVGMDREINELEAIVSDQDSEYRVISITGMAGLGKTTLARKVYNSVRQKFECSAWIFVSQQPNPNELLYDIASQVRLTEEDCKHNLVVNLSQFLSQKRYLIVIDDIWHTKHWDALTKGIPVNFRNDSKIIITSRSTDICGQTGRQNFLYKLQLHGLDEEKSKDLFFKMVAAPQDNDEDGDPSQLDNIGEKILKRCDGVPLAIVVISGLLRARERSIHAWEEVLESIGKDKDPYSEIFALSYKDLPLMLKPCFLYFGLFPEDYEISAFQLINLWAAEGFIHGREGRAVEDVGQDYLNHLVGRNLIQVVERRFNGTVGYCRIHDILHALCIRNAREVNFFNTLNVVATSADCLAPRRVTTCFQSDAGNYASLNYQSTNLRALLWLDDLTCDSGKQKDELCLRNFKSLRVLIIWHYSQLTAPVEEIMKLKRLHHLELVARYRIQLPNSISNLKHLLTLDLHQCRELILPDVIWKMKQLRHILFPLRYTVTSVSGFNFNCHRFHPREVSLPNLQSFYGLPVNIFEANWLHKLYSLRRLKVCFNTAHIIEALSSAVCADSLSKKLEELSLLSPNNSACVYNYILPPCEYDNYMAPDQELCAKFSSTLDLSKYVRLGKLHVRHGSMVDFPRHDKLPPYLTELILEDTRLKEDPMVILKKLPILKILILGPYSYIGKKMVCSGEANSFPQLEVLKIYPIHLEEFVAEEEALPKLKDLTLSKPILRIIVPQRIETKIFKNICYLSDDTWDTYVRQYPLNYFAGEDSYTSSCSIQ